MSDFTIRPATAADIPAITAIYAFEVREKTASFEMTPPDEAEMMRRFAAITGGGFPYLVADVGGHVAGYAYAGPYRPRPAYRYTVENSVYLDPAYYRRGIGRALLDELIAQCTAHGYRQMIAVIGDSANAASIGLHRSAGFAMIGTHPNVGFKFGRWLDSVQMQLALGDGGATTPAR
ncbi:GNAT family N-acetyltransferase [[Pseudomonas] carboxydohydrogena]|uniref:GNAT family N-acetyltransferase n=1 Tax=Afipia carboxydohydrogena TaxID=290 RepID=A0ABY8BS63_AFICR|nr:GNAT family N-acetyltransferase [[Pseudomonas] carboxydohydrogena]WEF51480.1 GNAT family N-acetyltransferase [[Pseudomonas] carboxydohydrogena]